MRISKLNAAFAQKQIMKKVIKYFWLSAKNYLPLSEIDIKRSYLLYQEKRD